MKPSPEFSAQPVPTASDGLSQPARSATFVYQGVTIVAMLLLLCTLWVF
jgi:hypothetical protein